jgi:hypothetical protein
MNITEHREQTGRKSARKPGNQRQSIKLIAHPENQESIYDRLLELFEDHTAYCESGCSSSDVANMLKNEYT